MLRVYRTVDDELRPTNDLTQKGTWISLVSPTEEELEQVREVTGVDSDFLRAPLDEEERSRIEADEGQLLILINVPFKLNGGSAVLYDTMPFGIIVRGEHFITVCLRENPLLHELADTKPRTCYTQKRTRLLLQLLFKTATLYLRYLRQIDRLTNDIENSLHKSMKNEELIKLLELEKSLVYFNTSLRSNEFVMEKLLRSRLARVDPDAVETSQIVKMYPEDEDLLDDVIIENKQAMEMCQIYSDILSGMMDAFASVISNNLNMVIKFLTSATIVLSIPPMVAGFFGMNVRVPLGNSPFGFPIILGISLSACVLLTVLLARKKMF